MLKPINHYSYVVLVTGLLCFNCKNIDTVTGCVFSTTCNADEVHILSMMLIVY